MSVGINRYKNDLRDLFFLLNEQFGVQRDVLGKGPFEAWGPDEVKATIEAAYRFAREVTGPLHASADREGCRVENGAVKTPKGFKEAWKQLFEQGFTTVSVDPSHGGQGAPHSVHVLLEEMFSGANVAFNM